MSQYSCVVRLCPRYLYSMVPLNDQYVSGPGDISGIMPPCQTAWRKGVKMETRNTRHARIPNSLALVFNFASGLSGFVEVD